MTVAASGILMRVARRREPKSGPSASKPTTPVLLRIPFSHFCRKAEWGLTQAGIAYDTWDMPLPSATMKLRGITPDATVPILLDDDRIVDGSDAILAWAADHAAAGTDPLYPSKHQSSIRRWETWAGDELGPLSRRMAYRVAYNQPDQFTTSRLRRLAARAAKGPILNILKFYRVRRYEEADAEAFPQVIAKISDRLAKSGTGYLFGDAPTAADVTVAALFQPVSYIAPSIAGQEPVGWDSCMAHLAGNKPGKTTRRRRHLMAKRHWRRLRAAAKRKKEAREEELVVA